MSEKVFILARLHSPWNDRNTVSKSVRNNEFFAYRANVPQCTVLLSERDRRRPRRKRN